MPYAESRYDAEYLITKNAFFDELKRLESRRPDDFSAINRMLADYVESHGPCEWRYGTKQTAEDIWFCIVYDRIVRTAAETMEPKKFVSQLFRLYESPRDFMTRLRGRKK